MKFSANIALLAVLASTTNAFTTSSIKNGSETALSAQRRDVLETVFTAGMASLFVGLAPEKAMAEPRPMYLSEPTDEFKANEAKAMEFKRAQLAQKKEFNVALEKFLGEANNEEAIVKDLNVLQSLVAKDAGLPLGIKKEELFKMIRSKNTQKRCS